MSPTRRFADLLGGDANGFALDEAAMLIAAHARPGLDVPAQLGRLDAIAESCPRPDFPTLLHHLCSTLGFIGNTDNYYDPANSLLDEVIDRRVGIPISLSILVIEVGHRLNIPLAGVGMPGHFLVRHDLRTDLFADAFGGPRLLSSRDCRQIFEGLGTGGPWDDRYLAPISRRAIVVRVLSNLKAIYQQTNDVGNLRWVMRLRAEVPGVGDGERDEFRRLMARLN